METIIRGLKGDRIFFTSDTHFNHSSIIRHCNRPFANIEQMNEALIENWNRVVGKNDKVFHLGDFSFGGTAQWNKILDQLNGKIYLIIGNHDIKNMRNAVIGRFEQVAFQMYLEIEKQEIVLNHNPFLCYGGSYNNVWQLFGHVHTRENNTGLDAPRLSVLFPRQYDVGVDANNFTPISFKQVSDIIKQQILQSNEKIYNTDNREADASTGKSM